MRALASPQRVVYSGSNRLISGRTWRTLGANSDFVTHPFNLFDAVLVGEEAMPGYRRYETIPKIDLALLVRHGVMEPGAEWIGFVTGDLLTLFRYWEHASKLTVAYELDYLLVFQDIRVGFAKRKQGLTPFLVCPELGGSCNDLYLLEDRFVSRRAHPDLNPTKAPPAHRREAKLLRDRDRLLGTDGRPPAQGAERDTLVAMFSDIMFARYRWPELARVLAKHELAVMRTRRGVSRSSRRKGLLGTRYAMLHGKTAPRDIDLAPHLALTPEAWLKQIAEPRAGVEDGPVALIEDQPALDLRTLAREWSLDEAGIWATILEWPSVGGTLIADFRDPDRPFLVLREHQTPSSNGLPDLLIRLVPSAHKKRWFLQCPLSHKRCEVLYYRHGMFASASAHKLVHRSQRKAQDRAYSWTT